MCIAKVPARFGGRRRNILRGGVPRLPYREPGAAQPHAHYRGFRTLIRLARHEPLPLSKPRSIGARIEQLSLGPTVTPIYAAVSLPVSSPQLPSPASFRQLA